MIRKIGLLMLSFIIVLCFACCSENDYFDTHKNIKQAIQKKIETDNFEDKYIIMKTRYMEEIINQGEKLIPIDDLELYYKNSIEIKEGQIASTLQYIRIYSFADSYLSLDNNQKINDYFKAIIAMEITKEEAPDWIELAEDNISYNIDEIASEEVVLDIYDGVSINLNVIIQNTANDLGMTFEECLEDVYAEYALVEAFTEFYQMYYLTHIYNGEKIEYNGKNDDEYVEYYFSVYAGYDEYMDQLVIEVLSKS